MVHMSHVYLTKKQMPRTFWYYAIKHSARMMNMVPGKYGTKLTSPFMLAHGTRPDPRTRLLSSQYATFIMRRTMMPQVLSHRPTPWTALFLVTLPRQMPSSSTTRAISAIMNPTATRSIPIASPPWCTPQSSTMADYLFCSTAMGLLQSANPTHRAQESLTLTLHQDEVLPGPWWISLSTLHHPHSTSSYSTTV